MRLLSFNIENPIKQLSLFRSNGLLALISNRIFMFLFVQLQFSQDFLTWDNKLFNLSLFNKRIIRKISMQQIIEIDGSLYEGGGQMIRSSLALSIIFNKQFTIHSIRKNRPNPGINNQLRSVFAAFTAKVPKVGDSEAYFYPKFLSPTVIKANTAASCTLMMQCLMPVCVGLNYDTQIRLQGGTDVSKSPSLESVREGLAPLLDRIGINLQLGQIKKGYYPIGKGYVNFKAYPRQQLIRPIDLSEISPPKKIIITYYVKQKKVPGSCQNFVKEIRRILNQTFGENIKQKLEVITKYEKVFNTKDQYGIGCMILGDNLVWDVGTVGQKIQQQQILERLQHYAEQRCCLDEHHQDQLLILLSLAAGKSKLKIGREMSLHAKSLFYVIKKFIPQLKYQHDQQTGILTIDGIGFKLPKNAEKEEK